MVECLPGPHTRTQFQSPHQTKKKRGGGKLPPLKHKPSLKYPQGPRLTVGRGDERTWDFSFSFPNLCCVSGLHPTPAWHQAMWPWILCSISFNNWVQRGGVTPTLTSSPVGKPHPCLQISEFNIHSICIKITPELDKNTNISNAGVITAGASPTFPLLASRV